MSYKTEGLFDAAVLCCPVCRHNLQLELHTLCCMRCNIAYTIIDGIPALLADSSLNTQLDHLDYDKHHGITDNSQKTLYHMWETVLDEYATGGGSTLELGCGTGQLTATMVNMSRVSSIYATDISQQFLQMTKKNIDVTTKSVFYYACDANHLPFVDNTFDLIVANSVLHHLLDYPRVLQQCLALLKPGGSVIFFEPVLQGKIMVAFLADLMLRIHRNTGHGTLTEQDCQKIERMIKHISKSRTVGSNLETLAQMEDKYVFDIHELKALALQSGFSEAFYRNNPAQDGRFRFNLHQHLCMAGIDEHKISEFRFLMNSAQEMLIEMLPNDLYTPMGFFVFRK